MIFPNEVYHADKIRLINQLWKLVPMREHAENWKIQLNTVLEEIRGLIKVNNNQEKVESLILLSKLEGLTSKECEDFMLYRKTVFKCIDLLSKVMPDVE